MPTPPDLTVFCEREFPRLVGTLGLYCGDRWVAEELAQEALARICRDWPRISAMVAPGPYVNRIAINLANSHYRRKQAERRAKARQRARADLVHLDSDTAWTVTIRRVLADLPERQRTAVVLRYYADLPMIDIAAAMEISVGGAKSQLSRGISALRARLGDEFAADLATELQNDHEEAADVR